MVLKRKHYGGYLQRIAAASDADNIGSCSNASATRHSYLALILIRDLLWGRLPSSRAVRYSRAAVRDGLLLEDLVHLSKCGSDGTQRSHTWRDFKRKFKKPRLSAAIGSVKVVMKSGTSGPVAGEMAINYPHKYLATLFKEYPEEFRQVVLGGDAALVPQFWEAMRDHPAYDSHPMHVHPLGDFRTHAIPFQLYGDGTPGVGVGKPWAKMVDGIIFSSCLVHDLSPVLSNFLIAFIYDLLSYVDDSGDKLTEDTIWRHIVWSLYWAYQGVWPDRGPDNHIYTSGVEFDRAGTPLMGNNFMVVWVLQGDLDHMHKKMHLADPNSSCPCSLCRANSTTIKHTDHRDGIAAFLQTLWTNATYAAAHPHRHRVLRHVPGCGVTNYIPDVMHSKHLGSDRSFIGSALRNLTHYILPLEPSMALRRVWQDILAEYKKLPSTTSRFNNLTHNMIKAPSSKTPELRGKAAQIRTLVPVMVKIWSDRMDTENPQHRDVLAGLMHSAEIDIVLAENRRSPSLPVEAQVRLRKACFGFATSQAALVTHYHPETPLHNITSKTHSLIHIGMCGAYINPALGACWQGEDMMRVVRSLVQSSSCGSGPMKAGRTAMERYLAALDFEMSHRGDWWE